MSNSNSSNKKPKGEVILVAKAGQALLATGTLINPASFAANIADGQLGAMVATHSSSTRAYGAMLQAGDVVPDVDTIEIVQGTPYSADYRQTHPIEAIDHKAYVKSHKINAKNRLVFSASVAKVGSQDAWLIGNTSGSAGAIPVQSDADYKFNLQFVSVRNDRDFGSHGEEDLTISFSTPDYTALGTTAPLDHLVQNIVYNANLNSSGLLYNNPAVRRGNKNFISFAINTAGGSGVALSAVAAGTPIPVVVDSSGTTLTFTPNVDFKEAVNNTISNGTLTADSTIELVNLTSAGAAAKTDSILTVSLDDQTAFAKDEIPQVKVRLRVGLETSFDTATKARKVNVSKPYEGKGQGRKWKIQYDKRYGLNIYTAQNRAQSREFYITPPSYIDETLNYSAYIIQHKDEYTVQASHTSDYYYRTIILVPSTYSTEEVEFVVTAASGGAQVATFTLGGIDYTIDVTNQASVAAAADEIAADWLVQGYTAWTASSDGVDTVTFTKADNSAAVGTPAFAVDGGTLAGTIATTTEGGQGTTDATVLASLNAVLGPWLQSAYDLNLVEGSYPKVGNVAGDPAPDLGGGTPFV